jgi:hypothetical protein
MATLSPQKVIVFSVSSIPLAATHAVLILFDLQEFCDTFFILPSTLTHLILQCNTISIKKIIEYLPPTLTHLETENYFSKPFEIREPT